MSISDSDAEQSVGDQKSAPSDAVELPAFSRGRLVLRPFQTSDANRVHEICQDRSIAATTQNIPHPYAEDQAEQWIATLGGLWSSGKAAVFAICLADEDLLIGAIGLQINQQDHNAELGYWIAKDHWGRGVCTEAAAIVIPFGFEQLGLARIHSMCMLCNPASGRVLQKNGMQKEGVLRQHVRKWGVFKDVEVYGLLRTEFERETDNSTAILS